MQYKVNIRSNTPSFTRVDPKTAEQPMEQLRDDEDLGMTIKKNTAVPCKTARHSFQRVMDLEAAQKDTALIISENYQSNDISPNSNNRCQELQQQANLQFRKDHRQKRMNILVVNDNPVLRVSNVRKLSAARHGGDRELRASLEMSPPFKPSPSAEVFQTAISRLVIPSIVNQQKSDANLSKSSCTQSYSKMMQRKKRKQQQQERQMVVGSSHTTSLKRAECSNSFILQVSISQESLKTYDSSRSIISSILSEGDFDGSSDRQEGSGGRICHMSEEDFKLRIEKYVQEQIKSSIQMQQIMSPRNMKEYKQQRAENFRDNYLHENSMQNLSKISLLTPSQKDHMNSMKKLFPFDYSQHLCDNCIHHNTAIYEIDEAKASPFEGTRKMYHSIGAKGKEQVSLSLLDGCDILKYTSSSESNYSDQQCSKRKSQQNPGTKVRLNSMDRLSSTMKCSLGKINLNQHLNTYVVESALNSVRKNQKDAEVAHDSNSSDEKNKPNRVSPKEDINDIVQALKASERKKQEIDENSNNYTTRKINSTQQLTKPMKSFDDKAIPEAQLPASNKIASSRVSKMSSSANFGPMSQEGLQRMQSLILFSKQIAEENELQQSDIVGYELVSTSKEKEENEESFGRTLPSDLVPSSLNSSLDVNYNKNRNRLLKMEQSSIFGMGSMSFMNQQQPPQFHAKPKSKMLQRKMKKASQQMINPRLHGQSRNNPNMVKQAQTYMDAFDNRKNSTNLETDPLNGLPTASDQYTMYLGQKSNKTFSDMGNIFSGVDISTITMSSHGGATVGEANKAMILVQKNREILDTRERSKNSRS